MILFTSDTNNLEKEKMKCLIGYGTATVFCFVFQLIYEHFSHGVTSYYMVYAFLIPMIGGLISILSFGSKNSRENHLFRQLLCGSIIWLTLGSIYQGVLDIYGTTNHLVILYVIVAVIQLVIALLAIIIANANQSGNCS